MAHFVYVYAPVYLCIGTDKYVWLCCVMVLFNNPISIDTFINLQFHTVTILLMIFVSKEKPLKCFLVPYN